MSSEATYTSGDKARGAPDMVTLQIDDDRSKGGPSDICAGGMEVELKDPSDVGQVVLSHGQKVLLSHYLHQEGRVPGTRNWKMIMCSVGAHLVVVLCIVILIVAHTYRNQRQEMRASRGESPFNTLDVDEESTFYVIPVVFASIGLFLCYCVVICEACFSETQGFTDSIFNLHELEMHVDRMRRAPPTLTLTVTCWHMGGRSGKTKEVTHAYDHIFPIKRCVDASGPINTTMTKLGSVIRYKVRTDFGFLDDVTRREYNELVKLLQEKYRGKDKNVDISPVLHIHEDFDDTLVLCKGEKSALCLGRPCFWGWTLALLTMPYRIWFNITTKHARYMHVKLLACR